MDTIDYKILQLLSDNQYHSGEELAGVLSSSRVAICKRIAKLNKLLSEYTQGYLIINSITGKGYCLNNRFDCLELDFINKQINKESNNCELEFIPILDSTNNYLITKNIEHNKYYICLAEHQTNGRGRNTAHSKKTWSSPFGNNIYCSIAWHYQENQNTLLGLSLVAGIALAEVLQEVADIKVQLKWPNDILLNNKKVAGILTEIYGEPNGGCKLVIGFGINVHSNYTDQHLAELNKAINKSWTILNSKEQVHLSRNQIIAKLIITFVNYYNIFVEQGMNIFLTKWQQYDLLTNKDITIDIAGNYQQGQYQGIDSSGALLVKIDHELKKFHSGEISVSNF